MKLISNRKLYRLGVGVAMFMAGFLLYFIYVEVSFTIGPNDVTFRSRLMGFSNSSDIYVGRIPTYRIGPMSPAYSSPKKSRFKSAFRRQNGYGFISTDFDIRKTTDLFTTNGDVEIDENKKKQTNIHFKQEIQQGQRSNSEFPILTKDNVEIDIDEHKNTNIYYSKPEFQRRQHSVSEFSTRHSNKRRSTTPKGPTYSHTQIRNKTIDNLPNGKLIKTQNITSTKNDNSKSLNRRSSSSHQDNKRESNLNHGLTPLTASTKSHSAIGQGHNNNMKKTSSNNSSNSSDSNSIGTTNGGKYLVYLCDSVSWCGGWGDRQRGMVSSYHLSKLLGRKYRIVMTTPCNLTNFYQPNRVDWILKQGEIKPTTKTIVLNSISKLTFKDQLAKGDFNVRYPYDVIFLKTNQDLIKAAEPNPIYSGVIKSDKNMASKKKRFRSAWMGLMRPSDSILLQLQELVGAERLVHKGLISKPLVLNKTNNFNIKPLSANLSSSMKLPPPKHQNSSSLSSRSSSLSPSPSSLPKPLICAHVRMGKNPTIPMDEAFDSFKPSDIPKLLKFLQSKDTKNNAEFFLATDYEAIREKFIQFFGTRLIHYGGKIIHIDRQRHTADACVGFGVALLDQLVLSACDQLVVSRSGFSIHASHVRNSSNPTYIMEGGAIKILKA